MGPITSLFWFAAFAVISATDPKPLEYPYPRIVIMGQSGVGKSSIANVLAGCAPSNEDEQCFFNVCSGSDSCTTETSIVSAKFLGHWTNESYGEVTLVDTPGFGDSSGDDTDHLANMIRVLKNILGDANIILLCSEGGRFSQSTITMLLELESMFGRERLWDNVMIEVTKWAYDGRSIRNRERQGITEEGTLEDINDHIMEITHLDHPLEGIFLDSWAPYTSSPDHEDYDQNEQAWFQKYAKQLWEIANTKPKFEFYTIEDILGQLNEARTENDWLNEVIKNNISELAALVAENKVLATRNTEDITDIRVVNGRQDLLIAANEEDISVNGAGIDVNGAGIDSNNEAIGVLETDMDNLPLAPIGSVVAWLGGQEFPVPESWQLCNGSLITTGPMTGKNTPDLNGNGLFLRGGDAIWSTQEDGIKSHDHHISCSVNDPGHKHTDSGHAHSYTDKFLKTYIGDNADDRNMASNHYQTDSKSTGTGQADITTETTHITVSCADNFVGESETRPKNMVVQWIMKIK